MGGRGSSSASSKNKSLTIYEQALKSTKAEADAIMERAGIGKGGISENIPQWILDRENNGTRSREMSIERETEKAVLVNTNNSLYGNPQDTKFWVPKSQLQSVEKTKQEIKDKAANSLVSQKYSNYLKKLAQSNGIKIGNTSSWSKITDKLRKSKIDVLTREQFQNSKL